MLNKSDNKKIGINISIEMPSQVPSELKHKDITEKCCEYMSYCESDDMSDYHFLYLKTIYNKLKKKNNLPDTLVDLFSKLEDFMLKYDIDRIDIDADSLLRTKD